MDSILGTMVTPKCLFTDVAEIIKVEGQGHICSVTHCIFSISIQNKPLRKIRIILDTGSPPSSWEAFRFGYCRVKMSIGLIIMFWRMYTVEGQGIVLFV